MMSAQLTEVRSVQIICDSVLKETLLAHLNEIGVRRGSWWLVHCKDEHSTALFREVPQMRIELWCHADVAQKVVDYCTSSHFDGIGMSVGVSPLLVSAEKARAHHKT